MRKAVFIFALLFSVNALSQKVIDKFEEVITKEGDTLRIGQTLTLGIPTGADNFRYITQTNIGVANWLAGVDVTIHKLQSIRLGSGKNNPAQLFVLFKGYGLAPVYIQWETARKTGEVERPTAD